MAAKRRKGAKRPCVPCPKKQYLFGRQARSTGRRRK